MTYNSREQHNDRNVNTNVITIHTNEANTKYLILDLSTGTDTKSKNPTTSDSDNASFDKLSMDLAD